MANYSIKTQVKGLITFLFMVLLLVMVVEFFKSSQNNAIIQQQQRLNYIYPSYEDHIDNQREIHFQKLITEMKEAQNNKVNYRPLRGQLKGKEEVFLTSFSNKEIGKYVISVLVAESGGGAYPCGSFNYSGIMYRGKCRDFESLEDYIENGIKKSTGIYFNKLYKEGVSRETLNNIFIGKGKYCTSGCKYWVNNFISTYQKL